MTDLELIPRRARILEGSYTGREGIAVGRDDPRVRAHPQPGHEAWEVFMFFDRDKALTGRPEDDGYGLGYKSWEVEFLG